MSLTNQIDKDRDVKEHLAAIREMRESQRAAIRHAGIALMLLFICIGANVPFAQGFPLHKATQTIPFFGSIDFVITMGLFVHAVIRCGLIWASWSAGNVALKDTVELLEIRYDLARQDARNFLRKQRIDHEQHR
ncbi:MAG TPA: hypothetical protein VGR47_03115 [Terracidiphilus sp.]|nr:hypothetical protein [Terracidiphilus sp.]